jgi:hypothetical protein
LCAPPHDSLLEFEDADWQGGFHSPLSAIAAWLISSHFLPGLDGARTVEDAAAMIEMARPSSPHSSHPNDRHEFSGRNRALLEELRPVPVLYITLLRLRPS